MIADLFWDAATSDLALAICAILLVASYLVGHIPIIATAIPQLAPYVVLARFVAGMAAVALLVSIGYRIADERADLKNARFEIAQKQKQLDDQKQTAADAQRAADEAAERANALQTKVDDYADELAKRPVGACALGADDIARLRGLWGAQKPKRSNWPGLRKPG